MKQKAALVAGALLVLTIASPALASPTKEVLGETTTPSEVVFPPVAAGPGFILPDSPFYALDRVFQKARLAVAVTPERRVEVRNLIVGERLAELRVMTERNNTQAVQTTLNEIANESTKIATDLADAQAQGKQVGTLAKNTNDLMKLQRDILKAVSQQANEPLALHVESTRQTMLLAKLRVEESLTEQEMLEAMENDLEDEVDTQVLGVETSLNKLEKRLGQIDKMVIKAAQKDEQNVGQDIRAEMKVLNAERKRIMEQIKSKRKALQTERSNKMRAALEQAKKSRQAIQDLRNARKAEKEGKLLPTPTVTPIIEE